MPLPKIQHPTFEVYLKSLDKMVRYRPFLVKEEKMLLMAADTNDIKPIVDCIKQIIINCTIDEIDVDTLPMFDVQMLFAHIRMKSVGENITLTYTCDKIVDGNQCNFKNDVSIDLSNLSYEVKDDHTKVIKVFGDIGICMKYPVLDTFDATEQYSVDDASKIIAKYTDYVFDADQIYDRKSYSEEDLLEFIDGLTVDQIEEVLNFFTSSPKVVIRGKVTCAKCNSEHNIYSEDIFDFFL